MQSAKGSFHSADRIQRELVSRLREPMPGQRWISTRQPQTWSPPTDVFETNDSVIVKVEIAGMEREDFAIVLDANKLIISGVRQDPAAKLGYQQMEILYGHFEAHVHLPRALDLDNIEATYSSGFLSVRLPKAKPRQVPVAGPEEIES